MAGEGSGKGKIPSLFESRRFWAAVGGVLVATAGHWGVEISQDTANQLIAILVAWIAGDTFRRTE